MREKLDQERSLVGPFADNLPPLIAAAHELKSPLALIRQLSLILEHDNEINDYDREQLLRQITLTSERALRLTSDLTKYARMDEALFKLEPINPKQLCEDIISELTPLFIANNRKIVLNNKKRSLLLVANRDLLRRVLMNFSDNALHYSDEETAVEINIGTSNHGKTVRLGVRDYGPAVMKDVFQSLSQGKLATAVNTLHARPNSSGLGLYISSQFAEIMQGKLGVTKHRDGATFYIDLQLSTQLCLL